MITPERTGLLKSFLGSLPESIAAKLARAVEIDRLADGKMLPHDMILEGLRPVLRRVAGSDRTPTPLRLFCQPFEDLFSAMPRLTKQKGRLSRASAEPVWGWLSQTVMSEEVRLYAREFKNCVVTGQHAAARARAAAFWGQSGVAMRAAFADPTSREAAELHLGSPLVVADAQEMATLLLIGEHIAEVQAKMPKFTAIMNEDVLHCLRTIYEQVLAVSPDGAAYVGVVAMNRLMRPWEALKLAVFVSNQTQDTKISSTDMGLVGEIMFSDIEAYQTSVKQVRHPVFDAAEMVEHLSRFTSLSSGIVKGIEIRRDGKWGQRLLKDRAELAEVMDGFMERAPKELASALPLTNGSPPLADFGHGIEDERKERALRYTRLVAGCRPFAMSASFGASQKKADDEMAQLLRNYIEDLLKELRRSHAGLNGVVESQFELVSDLSEIFFGEEETDLLRRRARAARASQVAA